MFNLGFSEVILIFVIALVFIGPKQLPQVAKFLGRLAGDVKRAMGDFNQEINNTVRAANDEIKKTQSEIEKPLESKKIEHAFVGGLEAGGVDRTALTTIANAMNLCFGGQLQLGPQLIAIAQQQA